MAPTTPTSRARALRRAATDAERKLWRLLRARQFADYKFRRQKTIGPYIVDFVCMERLLVIEADGGQHLDARAAYDAERDAWLATRGYRVVRFSDRDILARPAEVAEQLLLLLQGSPPEPSP